LRTKISIFLRHLTHEALRELRFIPLQTLMIQVFISTSLMENKQ